MPTIIVKCQPDWLPTVDDEVTRAHQAYTSLLMARWLVPIVPDVINLLDDRSGDKAIKVESVWADFEPMSPVAINSAQVLVIIKPPEIDGTFDRREFRRQALATHLRRQLWQQLEVECDHLILPKWEIEVLPELSSGFGVTPKGEIAYSW